MERANDTKRRMPWLSKFILALLALGVIYAYIANDRYITVQGEPFVFDKWEQVYIVPSAGVTMTLKKGN